MGRSKSCTWRGTAARGVYKPACAMTKIMGIPPRPGAECPFCGRPAVHWRPKAKKPATMKDYLKWKSAQQHGAVPK